MHMVPSLSGSLPTSPPASAPASVQAYGAGTSSPVRAPHAPIDVPKRAIAPMMRDRRVMPRPPRAPLLVCIAFGLATRAPKRQESPPRLRLLAEHLERR